MFLINVIFQACQWAAARLHTDELALVGAMCLVLFATMVVFEVRVCGFQFLSYYFLFYTLGYCVHRFPLLQVRRGVGLVGLFAVWAVLAWFWNMHTLPAWMPAIPHMPASLMQYAYRGLTAAVAILGLFGASPLLLGSTGRGNLAMKEVGNVSLGLYVCHLTLMTYVVKLTTHLLPGTATWALVAISFIACALLSLAIVELLKRNQLTARIFLGKV